MLIKDWSAAKTSLCFLGDGCRDILGEAGRLEDALAEAALADAAGALLEAVEAPGTGVAVSGGTPREPGRVLLMSLL